MPQWSGNSTLRILKLVHMCKSKSAHLCMCRSNSPKLHTTQLLANKSVRVGRGHIASRKNRHVGSFSSYSVQNSRASSKHRIHGYHSIFVSCICVLSLPLKHNPTPYSWLRLPCLCETRLSLGWRLLMNFNSRQLFYHIFKTLTQVTHRSEVMFWRKMCTLDNCTLVGGGAGGALEGA